MKAMRILIFGLLLFASATYAQSSQPTEVTFWGDWGGAGAKQFETMVDAFNASQNKVHVKYVVTQDMITKFLTASVSGNPPDIMFWDRWRTALYAPKNVLQPIDSYVKQDGIDLSKFYSEALRELTWNGNLYGLPLTVDARVLFYNKDLLAQAGLQPPKTWAELEQDAVALTKRENGKLVRAGFALDDPGLFSMYLRQDGGHMVNAQCTETTFDNAKGLAVLDFWGRLLRKDKVYEVGFGKESESSQDPFVTGKVAMTITGPWMINTYQQYGNKLHFGIVPPPAGPNGDKGSVMGGFGLVIPRAAKHKAAAWEFEKWWLAQPQNALLWAKTSFNLPGNKDAIQNPYFQDSPLWKPVVQTLDFAKIRPTCAGYSPMETDALIPNLQLFMEGKQSAQATLDKASADGNRILKQDNVP